MTKALLVSNKLQAGLANHLGIQVRHLGGFYWLDEHDDTITISSPPWSDTAAGRQAAGVDIGEEVYFLRPGSSAVKVIKEMLPKLADELGCMLNADYDEDTVTIKVS